MRLAQARADAAERITSLRHQWDSIVEASAWTSNDDEHDPEGSTVAFERAQLHGLLEAARAELVEIDRASERLSAGTYGWCATCGARIGQQRLLALPAVRTCIDCASRRR